MWRFVHLSDTHLGSVVDGEWNNRFICTMMPEVIACLRRDLAKLQPDFILLTGDVASHQTRDAMFAARDFMDSLGFPYYPMGGNHDFVLEHSREWFLDAFHAHLPAEDTVYSFTHKNLHFCVLDAWWKWKDGSLSPVTETVFPDSADLSTHGARWALPPHEFAWLEQDLEAHLDFPTIVSLHYPAISIPQRLIHPNMKNAGSLDNGEMLRELLERYPQVKAVFTGHLHLHFIERVAHVTHVSTAGLPEYPVEFRDLQVHNDRIEVQTCGLSNPTFAARSLIAGHDWTAGQPEDRTAVIRLG